jgi:hypothetical protein
MKNLFLPLVLYAYCCGPAAAQSQEASVMSVAGANMQAAGVQLDWSVGEVSVEAYENPRAHQALLEGFHRSYLFAIASAKIADPLAVIHVYPNPFKQWVRVAMPAPNPNAQLEVFTMNGIKLLSRKINPEGGHADIDLSGLSPGSYLLSFVNLATGERKSQLIQKLN